MTHTFVDRQRFPSDRLYEAAFDLAFAWKGTSHTFRMPWLMVAVLASFQNGMTKDRDPLVFGICDEMADGFLKAIGDGLSGPKKGQIRTEIRRMGRRLEKARSVPPRVADKGQMWEELFNADEFRVGLTATQALCYGNLYFQYEAFLIRCMKAITNERSIRVTEKGFKQRVGICRTSALSYRRMRTMPATGNNSTVRLMPINTVRNETRVGRFIVS